MSICAFKCDKCGKTEDKDCSGKKEKDIQYCNCGGKMIFQFSRNTNFIVYRQSPRVRAKMKKMGV